MKTLLGAAVALLALAAGAALWRERGLSARPDIFIILIDTLRPDHLGIYGYQRDTSPNIDRIARAGTVFERMYSVSPWTNPSVATLFTGLYPRALFEPAPKGAIYHQIMPTGVPTLARILGDAGYRTTAISDHAAISSHRGFTRDFQDQIKLFQGELVYKTEPAAPEKVVDALRRTRAPAGQPQFTYVHLIQPHWPYAPPPHYHELFGPGSSAHDRDRRDENINAYDAEIRYADDCVAAIESALRTSGRWSTTWLIVMSDHGEGFWEHGLYDHANSFYDELLRVPLILHPPEGHEQLPARVGTRLSTIDLMPTVLDMAGMEQPSQLPGRSLLRKSAARPRPLFSEAAALLGPKQASIIRGPFKLIDAPVAELYDLDSDPGEQRPIAGRNKLRQLLHRQLERHRDHNRRQRRDLPRTDARLDPETEERLRALGYQP